MKKIVLCALVVFYIVCLHGCAKPHVNLSSRDIKTTPLPIVSTYRYYKDLCYLFYITAIDGKPLANVSSANVDPGTHEVEYECYGTDGKIKQSERIKITAEPGMSYVLKVKSTTVNGITVDVFICQGYPYMTERKVHGVFVGYIAREVTCMKEPSLLLKFLTYDGVVYHPLF